MLERSHILLVCILSVGSLSVYITSVSSWHPWRIPATADSVETCGWMLVGGGSGPGLNWERARFNVLRAVMPVESERRTMAPGAIIEEAGTGVGFCWLPSLWAELRGISRRHRDECRGSRIKVVAGARKRAKRTKLSLRRSILYGVIDGIVNIGIYQGLEVGL